jgi:hypothetical protein
MLAATEASTPETVANEEAAASSERPRTVKVPPPKRSAGRMYTVNSEVAAERI